MVGVLSLLLPSPVSARVACGPAQAGPGTTNDSVLVPGHTYCVIGQDHLVKGNVEVEYTESAPETALEVYGKIKGNVLSLGDYARVNIHNGGRIAGKIEYAGGRKTLLPGVDVSTLVRVAYGGAPPQPAPIAPAVVPVPTMPTGPSSVFVTSHDGLLTVKAEHAPLIGVLQEVARHANIAVFAAEEGAPITIQFENLELEDALRRLLRDRNHVLVSREQRGESTPPPPLEVYLFAVGQKAVAPEIAQVTLARTPAPVPPVQKFMEAVARSDRSREDSAQAIEWLGSRRLKKEVPLLGTLLQQSPDAMIREEAAGALARIGGRAAVSALQPGLADPDPEVRREVVDALRRSKVGAAVIPLAQALLTDDDPNVRMDAAQALGRMRRNVAGDALQAALNDPDRSVRKTAEEALARWRRINR